MDIKDDDRKRRPDDIDRRFPGNGNRTAYPWEWDAAQQWLEDLAHIGVDCTPLQRANGHRPLGGNLSFLRSQLRRRFRSAGLHDLG